MLMILFRQSIQHNLQKEEQLKQYTATVQIYSSRKKLSENILTTVVSISLSIAITWVVVPRIIISTIAAVALVTVWTVITSISLIVIIVITLIPILALTYNEATIYKNVILSCVR